MTVIGHWSFVICHLQTCNLPPTTRHTSLRYLLSANRYLSTAMPNFRFQTLLNYRERIVEDRQIELAEAQRGLVTAVTALDRLRGERSRHNAGLQRLVQGVLHVEEIEHQYRYLAGLDQRIEAQQAQVDAADIAVEEARARLEEAVKDRKTMEKLKEYDEQSFQTALRQHEAQTLDDLNIVRYRRA